MPKSKFFRVAVEGPTVDGRVIERSWLTEMAASYNRATYAARVNMEHIRGITADKPFKAYGDVVSLKAETVDIQLDGKAQKRMALFAEIEATDDLVAINRDKQKLYTSIEVNPNFANTGKAYLVGLAVTDSPASLGTELLTFAVKNPGLIRHGPTVQADGNVFSLGHETAFELADGTQGDASPAMSEEAKGLFSAAAQFFRGLTATATPTPAPAPSPSPVEKPGSQPPANDNDARFTALASGMQALTSGVQQMGKDFSAEVTGLRQELAAVKSTIATTDGDTTRRPLAAGGAAKFATDC